MAGTDSLLETIRRTRLIRVLLVYLGASFAVLEAVDLLSGKIALPEWVFYGAILLLLLGLPIVIATALVQSAESKPVESGPDRVRGTAGKSIGGARSLLTWRNALTGGVVAFALWGIAVTGWLFLAGGEGTAFAGRAMLVVLPFENLSGEQDEYFADGITDAITARIASLQGLGVISRQSAVQYKNSPKTAQQIGSDLGVDYILEGTIQRERPGDPESRVRVIPQLIRIADDTHVWAATYDEDMREVFRVQTEIAERVAQALNVTLLEPEHESLGSEPTESLEAYDYYLRGNDYFNRGQLGYLELAPLTAAELYEKAVELDPGFALAWAALSRAHTLIFDNNFDNTDERLENARGAAETALRLNGDLPEAHLALGEYFTVIHQYEQALNQFEIARSVQPNNAALRSAIGAVLGNRGRWAEGILEHRAAAEFDPRSANTARDLGDALYRAGRYAEAEAQLDRAIELAPDQILPYVGKIDLYIYALGHRDGARETVRQGSEQMGRLAFAANLLSQDYVYFRILGDGYGDVLDELSIGSFGRDTVSFFFYYLAKGRLHEERKQPETARAYYDSARVVLENGLRRWPNDSFWRRELGVALAGLGRQDDAIREALRSTELVSMSKNAVLGSQNAESLARVYAMVGEHDAAVDQLESVMSTAPWYSARYLQIDPIWETLYDHPRFRRLVGQQD